jgi:hypothetical protein
MSVDKIAIKFELPTFRITNNRCSIDVTDTYAFIEGLRYFAQLNKCDIMCDTETPISHNVVRLGKFYRNLVDYYATDTKEYNQRFWDATNSTGKHKYSMLTTLNGNIELIRFDDLDFLNGLVTLNNWISPENRIDFRINSVHTNSKLCQTYITYDEVDLNAIKELLTHHVISDLANIIIKYYMHRCSSKSYTLDPIQCETWYEVDDICRSCSTKMLEVPVRAKVRLEVIKDN